jgi:NADPH:quinone reductase-like Zn-dependent oxidoreductase
MMEHALPTVIGRDFSVVIDAVGDGRGDVAEGDDVLGFVPSTPPLRDGTYAEWVAGPDLVYAPKPATVSFEVAAAIPLAGVAALDAVEAVGPKAGETLLVAGATGGVGSFAVQLAAQRGARVIATARGEDEEAFVRSLGANETVDYTDGSVADALRSRFPQGIDALIDVVDRDEAFERMTQVCGPGGRVATTLGAADVDTLAAREIRATNIMATPTPGKLSALAEQVAAGTLRVEIQRTFPLGDAAAAIAEFASGTRGKLVIVV